VAGARRRSRTCTSACATLAIASRTTTRSTSCRRRQQNRAPLRDPSQRQCPRAPCFHRRSCRSRAYRWPSRRRRSAREPKHLGAPTRDLRPPRSAVSPWSAPRRPSLLGPPPPRPLCRLRQGRGAAIRAFASDRRPAATRALPAGVRTPGAGRRSA
jgi:hypothetical protein